MNTVTNIVTFADKDWLVTMADKDWPSPIHFIIAFVVGLLALCVLNRVVWFAVRRLHRKAGTHIKPHGEFGIAFSETFGMVEQLLFFLAAAAGLQVFGFAVAGWFAIKSVSQYKRWQAPPGREVGVAQEREAGLAHNRFQIYILGTGISIAAGGIAGVVYHYVLYLIPHLCGA